jgi:hypothetical protein
VKCARADSNNNKMCVPQRTCTRCHVGVERAPIVYEAILAVIHCNKYFRCRVVNRAIPHLLTNDAKQWTNVRESVALACSNQHSARPRPNAGRYAPLQASSSEALALHRTLLSAHVRATSRVKQYARQRDRLENLVECSSEEMHRPYRALERLQCRGTRRRKRRQAVVQSRVVCRTCRNAVNLTVSVGCCARVNTAVSQSGRQRNGLLPRVSMFATRQRAVQYRFQFCVEIAVGFLAHA